MDAGILKLKNSPQCLTCKSDADPYTAVVPSTPTSRNQMIVEGAPTFFMVGTKYFATQDNSLEHHCKHTDGPKRRTWPFLLPFSNLKTSCERI